MPLHGRGYRFVGERPRSTPTVRMVCFPHGGGSPGVYLALRHVVPKTWTVQCVRLTRDGTDAAAVVDAIALEVSQANDSIVLFGHSTGALLAYLVAAGVERMVSDSPACVVVSSSMPRLTSLSDPTDSGFWELLYDMIHLGGLPREIAKSEAAVRYAVSAYENDLYLARDLLRLDWPELRAPLTYVGGLQDTSVPDGAPAAWSEKSGQQVSGHFLAGAHFYFTRDRAAALGKILVAVEKLAPSRRTN